MNWSVQMKQQLFYNIYVSPSITTEDGFFQSSFTTSNYLKTFSIVSETEKKSHEAIFGEYGPYGMKLVLLLFN